jgi:hypothetical protein
MVKERKPKKKSAITMEDARDARIVWGILAMSYQKTQESMQGLWVNHLEHNKRQKEYPQGS